MVGRRGGGRLAHTRLLPLINLENHAFVRYILMRRGIITSTAERSPAGTLDEDDRREISILLEAAAQYFSDDYPFGPE